MFGRGSVLPRPHLLGKNRTQRHNSRHGNSHNCKQRHQRSSVFFAQDEETVGRREVVAAPHGVEMPMVIPARGGQAAKAAAGLVSLCHVQPHSLGAGGPMSGPRKEPENALAELRHLQEPGFAGSQVLQGGGRPGAGPVATSPPTQPQPSIESPRVVRTPQSGELHLLCTSVQTTHPTVQ